MMKGYYDARIHRIYRNDTSFRYALQIVKYDFSQVDIDELIRLQNLDFDPEYLKNGYSLRILQDTGLKTIEMFEIVCNYPTAARISNNLKNLMPRVFFIDRFGWGCAEAIRLAQDAQEISISNEQFLMFLQEALDKLPKRTFSQKNKEKVINSFMESF